MTHDTTPGMIRQWRTEVSYLTRYAGSGVLNTLVGFAVIFLLMWMGASPLLANTGGYAVGFVLGFIVSKRFVFRSQGHLVEESLRYLAAFCMCFMLNLLVLSMALAHLAVRAELAQVMAAATYTFSMYLLTRLYVFRKNLHR